MLHNIFHVSLLREFRDNGLSSHPPGLDFEGEEEYELDGIAGHRVVRGRRQFLVSFKGYDRSEDMWLPESELGNAK